MPEEKMIRQIRCPACHRYNFGMVQRSPSGKNSRIVYKCLFCNFSTIDLDSFLTKLKSK